jgi:hypothetical protein
MLAICMESVQMPQIRTHPGVRVAEKAAPSQRPNIVNHQHCTQDDW